MRKTLALTLLALMVVAANAFAVGEGRIQVAATGISALLPQAHAGKTKLLMVHNRQRSLQAPEVPTAIERSDLTHSNQYSST